MLHGEIDLTSPVHDFAPAVLPKNTYKKSPWLVVSDFNQYTAITLHLLIILTDGALIIFTCIWPFA